MAVACVAHERPLAPCRWNTTRRNLLDENMERPAHILNEEKKFHRGWLREIASVSGLLIVLHCRNARTCCACWLCISQAGSR